VICDSFPKPAAGTLAVAHALMDCTVFKFTYPVPPYRDTVENAHTHEPMQINRV